MKKDEVTTDDVLAMIILGKKPDEATREELEELAGLSLRVDRTRVEDRREGGIQRAVGRETPRRTPVRPVPARPPA